MISWYDKVRNKKSITWSRDAAAVIRKLPFNSKSSHAINIKASKYIETGDSIFENITTITVTTTTTTVITISKKNPFNLFVFPSTIYCSVIYYYKNSKIIFQNMCLYVIKIW